MAAGKAGGGIMMTETAALWDRIDDDAGHQPSGRIRLVGAERICLAPDMLRTAGPHALRVHPSLETPCGDAVGERFEHSTGLGLGSLRRAATLQFMPQTVDSISAD